MRKGVVVPRVNRIVLMERVQEAFRKALPRVSLFLEGGGSFNSDFQIDAPMCFKHAGITNALDGSEDALIASE